MRILVDCDGDVWREEYDFDLWYCLTARDIEPASLSTIQLEFSPVTFYAALASQKDTSTYQITYDDGGVKHGNRRVLAAVVGSRSQGYREIAKVERAADVKWTDVTSEFVTVLR